MHTVTASITYGHSLHYIRLQPPLHTVTASITYGYSLHYIRCQPPLHTISAADTIPLRLPAGDPKGIVFDREHAHIIDSTGCTVWTLIAEGGTAIASAPPDVAEMVSARSPPSYSPAVGRQYTSVMSTGKRGEGRGQTCPPLAAPQLGSCASSARAWRLCAARHSQGRGQATGRAATASGARASRLQSRRLSCL